MYCINFLNWFLFKQAHDYEIYDLKPFFSSTQFSRAHFELDAERGVIRHRLARWRQNEDENM